MEASGKQWMGITIDDLISVCRSGTCNSTRAVLVNAFSLSQFYGEVPCWKWHLLRWRWGPRREWANIHITRNVSSGPMRANPRLPLPSPRTIEAILLCHLVIISARQNSLCFSSDVLIGPGLGVRVFQATHIRWRSEVNVDPLIRTAGIFATFSPRRKQGQKRMGLIMWYN